LSQLANLGPDLGQTRVRPDTPIGSGTTMLTVYDDFSQVILELVSNFHVTWVVTW